MRSTSEAMRMASLGLGLLRKVGDLVEIADALEPGDRDGGDVADLEVGVQAILEGELFVLRIGW